MRLYHGECAPDQLHRRHQQSLRVWQYKHHAIDGFTRQHGCATLVYIAEFDRRDDAIAWEKALKGKSREKKVALIEERNPRWNDLAWNWYDEQVGKTT